MRSSPQTIPPPPKFGYRSWQIPPKTKGKTPGGCLMVTKSPQSGPRESGKSFVYRDLQEGMTIV